MKLGLALSPCAVRQGIFDPRLSAASGLWLDYSSGNWTGSASTGASGGIVLTAAGSPVAGTALGGRGTVLFDGVDDVFSSALPISSFIGATAAWIWVMYRASVAGAGDPGGATRYQGQTLLSDSAASGFLHVGHNASGFYGSIFNNSSYKSSIGVGTSLNTWVLGQFRITSTGISARYNGGAWHGPIAHSGTGIDTMTGVLTLGTGFTSAAYAGLIAGFGLHGFAPSDAQSDGLRAWAQSYWGVGTV